MGNTAEELLEAKRKRIVDAANLDVPDQVPLFMCIGTFAAQYAHITCKEGFSDKDKWLEINKKLLIEYQPDAYMPPMSFDIVANEMVGTKNYNWPGHGLPDTSSFQFHEGEFMTPEEYDDFIDNRGDFLLRKYLPRVYGNLEGLSYMPPLESLLSYNGLFSGFSNPAVLEAFDTIGKACRLDAMEFMKTIAFMGKMQAYGFPMLVGFASQAPFDIISDYLRGLKGSTLDIFRCPDKLMAAQEKLLPYLIKSAVDFGKMMGAPINFIALHRGSDGFMSIKQFEKFYWQGLKKLLLAMVNEGVRPFVFWEGVWDERLEYLIELPKGQVVGWFDRTDLVKAKKVIGGNMCICGNMPLSLLQTGSRDQIRDYTKKLIDEVGMDGGFIMAANTQLDDADPDRVRTWIDCTREYGIYK